MNSKTMISIFIGVVIIIGVLVFVFFSETKPEPKILPPPDYEINFTYSDIEKIQQTLRTHDILVSNPTEITDHTVDQYCTYFDDDDVQQFVKYCTTTSVIDSNGNSIGNINIGGTVDESVVALALIETGTLDSKQSEISVIFKTMIESLVCDCWDQLQPGDFESSDDWINATVNRYSDSGKTTIESKINGLDHKQLILEITSTENSYLWTLIIVK